MSLHPTVEEDLARSGIGYEMMECDPELADTAAFCAAYGIPMRNSANAILVASRKPEGLYAMCLVRAIDRLDVNGTVRRRLGARKVSFASPEDTLATTSQAIGGVTVFGIPDGIPIWVDKAVLGEDWVVVGAGSRTAKLKLDPEVFANSDRFEIVPGLAKEET